MGGECGCCSSYEARLLEKQLENASRPQKQPQFEDVRSHIHQDATLPFKRKDEEKVSENPSIEGSPHPPSSYPLSPSNTKHHKSRKHHHHKSKSSKSPRSCSKKSKKKKNRFKGLRKPECVSTLKEMKVLQSIWVHKNKYDRWLMAHLTMKRLNIATDLHVQCHDNKNDPEYKEMKCLLLKNCHKVLNVQEHEYDDFKKCVLKALELVDNIYLLNLNSSNCDDVFLGEIFDVLIKRNHQRHESNKYGPEILDMENIPIKDDGIELICKYFQHKCKDTKWIKIGHFYGYYQMSSSLSTKFIESLEQNQYILKLDIEMPSKHNQHCHQKDKIIKRNEKKYREERRKKRKMTV